MLKLNQGRLIAMISFVLFTIGLIANSERFSYALDYELNVLKPECNFKLYKQNKQECIKVEYTESHIAR